MMTFLNRLPSSCALPHPLNIQMREIQFQRRGQAWHLKYKLLRGYLPFNSSIMYQSSEIIKQLILSLQSNLRGFIPLHYSTSKQKQPSNLVGNCSGISGPGEVGRCHPHHPSSGERKSKHLPQFHSLLAQKTGLAEKVPHGFLFPLPSLIQVFLFLPFSHLK